MGMNMSIGCDVTCCKHHHPIEKYCTLEHIEIDGLAYVQDKVRTNCNQFKTNE